MPKTTEKRYQDLIAKATSAVTNMAQPEIEALLTPYGLGQKGRALGQHHLTAANGLIATQSGAQGALRQITAQVNDDTDRLSGDLRGLKAIAKMAFQTLPGAAEALGVKGAIPRTAKGLVGAALKLHSNLTPEIREALRQFDFTDEGLDAIQPRANQLQQNLNQQSALKGQAQQATKDLQQALSDLNAWYVTLRRIARTALKQRPELMEALGIVVKPRRKPQKDATVPPAAE